MKVFVIGGGSSGLIAAIYASFNNDVTILEKNNVLGKKLLITGNGKCNYWNDYQDISNYNTSDIEELKNILTKDNMNMVLSLFDEIGIIPKIKNGYYYPYSNQATSIQTALIKEVQNRNIKVITEEEVMDISYNDKFIIKTNKHEYSADKVIIATGSKAAPKTGSDGIGYRLAQHFNHNIIEPKPALVGLKGKDNFYKQWMGVRSDVSLIYKDNIQNGEIQLTDYGISGVCVFNLSSQIVRDLKNKPIININFVPFLNIDDNKELINFFDNRNKQVKNRNISQLMDGFLNYKLVNLLLKLSGIEKDELWDKISTQKKEKLMDNLIAFKFEVTGSNDFDKAQTCSGGIPLSEIDTLKMESKKQKNLYFTGELIDVDGKCGGYNLEFAFITGYIAGKNV